MTNTVLKTDALVSLKINGQEVIVNLAKVHETWLARCLEYGVRRLINDSNSALKGMDKLEACQLMRQDMENGEAMPEKAVRASGASVDPVTALAVKTAKGALTAMFKSITGAAKALDFAQHEKIAPFFNVTEDRAVWNDGAVIKWMEAQAKAGKVDYMGDAKALLSTDTKIDLDF